MKISLTISTLAVSAVIAMLAWGKTIENTPKAALATDRNHDNKLSFTTVKNGEDFILMKQNPAKLSNTDLVLQTKNYNLYTAASWSDLQTPDSFKKLWLAKVAKDGTIKVYTLPNLGYSNIQFMQNQSGKVEIYLLTNKGKMDRIYEIKYKTEPFHIYDPVAEIKVKAL